MLLVLMSCPFSAYSTSSSVTSSGGAEETNQSLNITSLCFRNTHTTWNWLHLNDIDIESLPIYTQFKNFLLSFPSSLPDSFD